MPPPTAMAPPMPWELTPTAWLFVKVEFVIVSWLTEGGWWGTVMSLAFQIAPPVWAWLLLKVEPEMFNWPTLRMAPPMVAALLLNVQFVTVNAPRFAIAPPGRIAALPSLKFSVSRWTLTPGAMTMIWTEPWPERVTGSWGNQVSRPSMVRSPVMARELERRTTAGTVMVAVPSKMVARPIPGVKSMVSAPGLLLAWLIAQRKEPVLPSSSRLLTVKVLGVIRSSSHSRVRRGVWRRSGEDLRENSRRIQERTVMGKLLPERVGPQYNGRTTTRARRPGARALSGR